MTKFNRRTWKAQRAAGTECGWIQARMQLTADGRAPTAMSAKHSDTMTLATTSSRRRSLRRDSTMTGMLVMRTDRQTTNAMTPLMATTAVAALIHSSSDFHSTFQSGHSIWRSLTGRSHGNLGRLTQFAVAVSNHVQTEADSRPLPLFLCRSAATSDLLPPCCSCSMVLEPSSPQEMVAGTWNIKP